MHPDRPPEEEARADPSPVGTGNRPGFLADAMVADVARWLRILGEDCLWAPPDWSDRKVLEVARVDARVVVTRDEQLVKEAGKTGVRAVLVPQQGIDEVLAVVYGATRFAPEEDRLATRCSMCNGPLMEADGETAKHRAQAMGKQPPLPEVLERHEAFWSCTVCAQAYWRGTHWDPIERVRRGVLARLGA